MPGTHGTIGAEYKMDQLARMIDSFFNGGKKGHDRTIGFALFRVSVRSVR